MCVRARCRGLVRAAPCASHGVCGGGGARSYEPPSDAGAGDGGRRGASRIVRSLLRVDPADRDDAAAAVAKLEALLFVVPLLPPGALRPGARARARRITRPPQVPR